MPRGRKKMPETIQEQIDDLESKIENAKNTLKDLQSRKKALEEKKEQEELAQIRAFIENSGKTVKEFLSELTENENE